MNKIKKYLGCIVLIILVILGYFGFVDSKNNAPEFVLTYAENQPEDYPTTLGGYYFAELVEEKTEGRIKIIIQAEGVLGDEKSIIEQLKFGGIDFARVGTSALGDSIPILNILQMPYLYEDAEHMWNVLEGEIGEYILNKLQESGIHGLSWYDAGTRNFYTSTKPIYSLEDLEGMRIRVQESQLMVDMIEALGAIAVPMIYADVYSGLEMGLIEGAENNWPSYESSDHFEVAKYYTLDEHSKIPEVQLCSQVTWEKFSKEDQQIIIECARESALYERELWREREEISRNRVISKGVIVIELTVEEKKKFQQAVEGIYEKYCVEYKDIIEQIKNKGSASSEN